MGVTSVANAVHAERLRILDPLVLVTDPSGEPTFRVESGSTVARGWTTTVECAVDSEAAVWGALRTHALTVHVTGEERTAAVSTLLDRWDGRLRDAVTPGDDDSAAVVRWPSRDLEGARALVLHGFAPLKTIAVRTAGRSGSSAEAPPDGVAVRRATSSDAPRLGELAWELMLCDVPWGMVTARPGAKAMLARGVAAELTDPDGLAFVAVADGTVIGYSVAQSVAASAWISGIVAADPVVYLPSLYVDPRFRSTGAGTALARATLRELDAAGVAATALHYATPSPVSAPFWARMGFRPLWTMWQRRPASPVPA